MDKHITVHELALKLKCSRETVRRRLRSGELPGGKMCPGGVWKIDPQAVELALSRHGSGQSRQE
jgi:excisionase family DNA binding protein